jgi:hypothetical protein
MHVRSQVAYTSEVKISDDPFLHPFEGLLERAGLLRDLATALALRVRLDQQPNRSGETGVLHDIG